MSIKNNEVVDWIKDHKTEVIIVSGTVIILAGAIFGVRLYNKRIAGEAVLVATKSGVHHDFSNTLPFNVSSHIRRLPEGMHASPAKELTALEHGYQLKPGETWVEAYVKMSKAA